MKFPQHPVVHAENRAGGSTTGEQKDLLHGNRDGTKLQARRRLQLRAERLPFRPNPAILFRSLYADSDNAVWLDSSNAPTQDLGCTKQSDEDQTKAEYGSLAAERSRFSIMADDGGMLGQSMTHLAGHTNVQSGDTTVTEEGSFFKWLAMVWGDVVVDTPDAYTCEFTLGWLGYLGYELKRETGGDDYSAHTPDAALIFAGRAVVLDHAEGTSWLLALDAPDANEWFQAARAAVETSSSPAAWAAEPAPASGDDRAVVTPGLAFKSRETAAAYREKIAAAQHQIYKGNSYEICLTTTLSAKISAAAISPLETYLALRHKNPAPFASYLRFHRLAVASSSPERFLKIASDGSMRAEPIKGTRPRISDPSEDMRLREQLAKSLKDRAENIMIVDLLRNDLSHFAVPGSVTVSRLCAIESYATVHQMVSTIDAQLQRGASRAEAVAACFPAGSMTGAPKISTMAILDGLEGDVRGPYSGAIGYFSLNGSTDLSVAIRTLVINTGEDGIAELTLGVGGAITSDSLAHEEYEEIRTKAYGVLSALGTQFPGN